MVLITLLAKSHDPWNPSDEKQSSRYARVGLMGNPSDGFHGKVGAMLWGGFMVQGLGSNAYQHYSV